jgi:hypothetical protein
MIVKIAACLYLLQAALGLWSMFGPFGFRASLASLVALALSALCAAIGVGLFKHLPWARWLALGSSLIGWTLGSLVFLGLLVAMFFLGSAIAVFGGGMGSAMGFVMAFVMLIFAVSIVINFLLYFYLRSEAGAAEFGVERESFGSVMGSVGVWVAIFVVEFTMSTGAIPSAFPSGGSDFEYEPAATQAQSSRQTPEYQRMKRNVEEQRAQHRAALEAQERERLEAERVAQAESYDTAASDTPASDTAAPDASAEEAEAPAARYEPTVSTSVASSESSPEPASRNQILRCRDASGATQYTQGYCPPGTTRVEMPTN